MASKGRPSWCLALLYQQKHLRHLRKGSVRPESCSVEKVAKILLREITESPCNCFVTSMSDKQWFSTLSAPMTRGQRRALLKKVSDPKVLSSLRRPEILMDFFTDCLTPAPNSSPDLSLAVPALQGLFALISTRNLDYPSFYPFIIIPPFLLLYLRLRSFFNYFALLLFLSSSSILF